jgi:hypothetical protein
LAALKQGKQLEPFAELMKYLVQGKDFSSIKTRFGSVELSFSHWVSRSQIAVDFIIKSSIL